MLMWHSLTRAVLHVCHFLSLLLLTTNPVESFYRPQCKISCRIWNAISSHQVFSFIHHLPPPLPSLPPTPHLLSCPFHLVIQHLFCPIFSSITYLILFRSPVEIEGIFSKFMFCLSLSLLFFFVLPTLPPIFIISLPLSPSLSLSLLPSLVLLVEHRSYFISDGTSVHCCCISSCIWWFWSKFSRPLSYSFSTPNAPTFINHPVLLLSSCPSLHPHNYYHHKHHI